MRPVLVIGKRNARGSATKHVYLNVQAVTFGVQKKLPVVCARMPLPAPGLYTVNGGTVVPGYSDLFSSSR